MNPVPKSNQWACVVRGLVCLGYVPGAPAYFVAKAARALCARLRCEHCGRVGPSYRPWRHPRSPGSKKSEENRAAGRNVLDRGRASW
jgi:hypothetical protein